MKPVVDFRVEDKFSPALSAYLEQVWVELARAWPAETFIFLTEVAQAEGQYPPNIVIKTIKKSSFSWLDQKRLLNALAEWQADCYVGFGQGAINIMKPGLRQFSKKDLQQPRLRIVFSEYERLQLPPLRDAATVYIKPALPGILFAPDWMETGRIRTQYTGSREYFLFLGDIEEEQRLIELLKAFSLFKKRQQSNMQLVITGYSTTHTDLFEEKLASYKYRADVVLIKDPDYEDMVRLAAAAYAMVYPAPGLTLPLALLMAVQSGVASIAMDTPLNRELAGGAAAWADSSRPEEGLSQAMMQLFKDEDYKLRLVQAAKDQAGQHDLPGMLASLAAIIYPH